MRDGLGRLRKLLGGLGAGLVAGASDNDPTSVATLAVVGSTTIYNLSWLIVLILPMLLVIQVVSSRLGVLAGKSLQEIIRSRFGRFWASVSLAMVVTVNIITIAADLEGGGAALSLLFGHDYRVYAIPLAVVSGGVLIFGRYRSIQNILRFASLIFVSYIGAGLLARPQWGEVLSHTVLPTFSFTSDYIAGALAILGSTLTSYVYFWETIEEEEERLPREELRRAQIDAAVGIIFTVVIFWFILIGTAATAGVSGVRVETAQDAALALRPLAGDLAQGLFAIGLLASAALALPVLAATTAYVVTQTLHREASIEKPLEPTTMPFYSVIVLSLAAGALVALLGIPPISLLFLASIAGGLGTPILLVLLFLAASDPIVMGSEPIQGPLKVAGWLIVAVVSLASLAYLAYQILGTGGR